MPTSRIRQRLFIGANAVVAIVAVGVIFLGSQRSQQTDAAIAAGCPKAGENHTLRLNDDRFDKERLTVQKCDTLTISNDDGRSYQLAFGVHDKHVDYPGYDAAALAPHESITINMIQTGTFEFHDHFRDQAHTVLTIDSKNNN